MYIKIQGGVKKKGIFFQQLCEKIGGHLKKYTIL